MMNDLFGISFTNSNMIVAHTSDENDNKIKSLDSLPYPFIFDYTTFFDDDKISRLSESLSQLIKEKGVEKPEIRISLPPNFAYIKKVAVPVDENQDITYSQADWEFHNLFPEDFSNYKIVKLDSEFVYGAYKELFFVCIRNSVIDKLNDFARNSGGRLRTVMIDPHSTEKFLKSKNLCEADKNQIVFKVDKYSMEAHLYIKGGYYVSYLSNIKNPELPEEQINLLNFAKEKYNKSKIIIDQLPFVDTTKFQIFLAGAAMDENCQNLFRKNFSEQIELLYSEQYTGLEQVKDKTIEALGIVWE